MPGAMPVAPVVTSFLAPPSGTRTNSAPTHTCLVGADGLGFIPKQLTADVGDIIEYQFFPQNHSVARAAFGNNLACVPYEDTGSNLVGFWSGFVPLSIIKSNCFDCVSMTLNPFFFYCASPGACQEGMIGVINPNSTFTYHSQLAYALKTSISFSPLQYFPAEVSISRTATVPESMTLSTCRTTISTSNIAVSGGSIAGTVIGSLLVGLLAAASLYQCARLKTMREILRQNQPYSPNPSHIIRSNISSQQNSSTGMINADGLYYPPIPNISSKHPPAIAMIGSMHSTGTREDFTKQQTPRSLEFPHPGMPIPVYAPRAQDMGHTPSIVVASTAVSADEIRPTLNQYIQPPQEVDPGPHELPAMHQGPSAPVLVDAGRDSPRPFSFAESDRGWNPKDEEAGVQPE